MTEPAWEIADVHHSWPDGRPVLRGVSLRVARGERVALVGRSGAGKSTLARIGFGAVRPTAGTARLCGLDVATTPRRLLAARGQLLFQSPRAMLHPDRSLRDLLLESARLHGHVAPGHAVDDLLARVGLTHRADALPHALSGGEQRRAGIARVLLARPALLVADEPTAGLDAARIAGVVGLLFAPDRATVLVTHDLPVALATCSRAVVLHEGRVVDDLRCDDPWAGATHDATRALLWAAGVAEPP